MTTVSDISSAFVYIYLPGDGYVPAGHARYDAVKKMCFFRYGDLYVERPNAIPIDPVKLPLQAGVMRSTSRGEQLFSALRDAAPDHWGRKLLSIMAERHVEEISEFELLVAGFTSNKVGALAFGPDHQSGPQSMAPWFVDIKYRTTSDLNEVAKVIKVVDEAEDDELDDIYEDVTREAFLRALALSPGVGGARPKCLFSANNTEYIVKFAKPGELWNEPLVEHATMTLAAKCGITVANTYTMTLDIGSCLFVERFDRTAAGVPRHFISGFTLGEMPETDDWGSYQDLAAASRRYGDPKAGRELFRRMVFNILCTNMDDHPRNHAFFVERNQIELTPAYDIVPSQLKRANPIMALSCGKYGHQASLDNALSNVAPFGITTAEAEEIVESLLGVCRGWPQHFRKHKVTDKDIEKLEYRFKLVN